MSKMQNWGREIVGDSKLIEEIYAIKNAMSANFNPITLKQTRGLNQEQVRKINHLMGLLEDLLTPDLNKREWEEYNKEENGHLRKNYERGVLRFSEVANQIRDKLAIYYCSTCDFEGDFNEATIHCSSTGHTCEKHRRRRMPELTEQDLDSLLEL